jgi:predicted N-acetyltransferase YhbS
MAVRYPIRPITEGELFAAHAVSEHAFHGGPQSDQARARLHARVEYDRTVAAFDGSLIVGTAGAFSFRMRVPGALAAVAGVTMVGVLPSHRRRGILSSLMRQQLDDVRERGEAVAALIASEAGIYGRFGYGRASWHAGFSLRAGEGALAPDAPSDDALRLRIAEPEAARAELTKVYEMVLDERPGFSPATTAGGTGSWRTSQKTVAEPARCAVSLPRTPPARAATPCSPAASDGTRTRSCRRASSRSARPSPPIRPPPPRSGVTCSAGT